MNWRAACLTALLCAVLAVTGAQAVPACPSSVVIASKATVRAGRIITLHVKVTNTNGKGGAGISGLNIGLTLPDNFCPSRSRTSSPSQPVVVGQNAYWRKYVRKH